MVQAIWNDTVIAESDTTVMVEGNHYFPPDAVKREFFESVDTTTVCPWKGTASYYDVVVDGQRNPEAVWYYPTPMQGAEQVAERVAFWHGVTVEA